VPSGTRKSLPGHLASTLGTLYVDRRQHFPSASTKMPPPVDKCQLPAPNFHAGHPVRGQAATSPLRIHKNAPVRGQKPPPGTELPRWAPPAWTKNTSGHRTSTLGTLYVDRRQHFPSASTKMPPPVDKNPLPAPNFHARHPVREQAAAISLQHPQKCPRPWTNATSRHRTSTKFGSNVDRRPKIDQKCSQKGNKSLYHNKNYNYLCKLYRHLLQQAN